MITIKRIHPEHNDFISLVKLLDTDLSERDGEDHPFYDQFNKTDDIKYAVVAYENEKATGCGAMKQYNPTTMEIKRMFTLPGNRGRGIGGSILDELELWARELGYEGCILETGKRQPEAISLYRKKGYQIIPNYGQYAGIDNSVCMEKNNSKK